MDKSRIGTTQKENCTKNIVLLTMQYRQEILISTGYLAAMEETCTMDVVAVKGVKNMLVGGEGIFNTVVRGPGKVILQTMPISKVAELLTPFFTKNK